MVRRSWLVAGFWLAGACGSPSTPVTTTRAVEPSDSPLRPTEPLVPQPLPETRHATGIEPLWEEIQPRWVTENTLYSQPIPTSDGFLFFGLHSGILELGKEGGKQVALGEKRSQSRRNFLARYDDSGELLWARNVGGSFPIRVHVHPDDSLTVVSPVSMPGGSGFDPDVTPVFGAGTPREVRVPECDSLVREYERAVPGRSYNRFRDGPLCSRGVVARYDASGELLWLRTIHAKHRGRRLISDSALLSDGSFVIAVLPRTIALVDAETPDERRLPIPLPEGGDSRLQGEPTSVLIRYDSEGAISWVRTIADEPFQEMQIKEIASLSGGDVGVSILDRRDPQSYRVNLGRMDSRGEWRWRHPVLDIRPSSEDALVWIFDLAAAGNDDLLLSYQVGRTNELVIRSPSDDQVIHDVTLRGDRSIGGFVARFDPAGQRRWAIQATDGTDAFFHLTVLPDQSWLASFNECGHSAEPKLVSILPGSPAHATWELEKGSCVARLLRFGADGQLDAQFDPDEIFEDRFTGVPSHMRPDGVFFVVGGRTVGKRRGPRNERPVLAAFRLTFEDR
jgi:hypothetical protein